MSRELEVLNLGTCINTLAGAKPLGSFLENGKRVNSHGNGPQPVTGYYHRYSHVFETHKYEKKQFELGLNITAIIPPVTGALDLDYKRAVSSTEDSIYGFFSCCYVQRSEELQNVVLPKAVMKLLTGGEHDEKNKKVFLSSYGNACITKVDYGKRVHASIRFKNLKKEKTSELISELSVKLNQATTPITDASGKLKFNASSNIFSKIADVEIELLAVGTKQLPSDATYDSIEAMFAAIIKLMSEDSESRPIDSHHQEYPAVIGGAIPIYDHNQNVKNAEHVLILIAKVTEKINWSHIDKLKEIEERGVEKYVGAENWKSARTKLDEIQGKLRNFIEDVLTNAAVLTTAKRQQLEIEIKALERELDEFVENTKWIDYVEKKIVRVSVEAEHNESDKFTLPQDISGEKYIGFHVTQHPQRDKVSFVVKQDSGRVTPNKVISGKMTSGDQLSVRNFLINPNKPHVEYLISNIDKGPTFKKQAFKITVTEKISRRQAPPPTPVGRSSQSNSSSMWQPAESPRRSERLSEEKKRERDGQEPATETKGNKSPAKRGKQ
jgi:hypothetical protein